MKPKKLPFAEEAASEEFFQEAFRMLVSEIVKRRSKHIPPANIGVFYHGRSWCFQRQEKDGYSPKKGEMKLKRTEFQFDLDRILANDLTLVSEFIETTAAGMDAALVRDLIDEVSGVAEETGNTINVPKGGSFADAFLKMVQTTEMSVQSDGKVSIPTLWAGPEFVDKLAHELGERTPEFREQIESARKEKEAQALAREKERLARFHQPE